MRWGEKWPSSAAFNKYGQTRDGYLPYPVFVQALMLGRNRLVSMASDMQKGAFVAGKRADFQGKIIYPPCRKSVFTPSDWDGTPAKRSAQLPDAQLELTFVHGYGRDCNANNLFYTSTGEVVYYTAGVGIVYDKSAHTQRFFLGHDDDLSCLTVSSARDLVASGQVGRTPHVCVWHPADCRQLARLQHPAVRGIAAVGFCRDAELLASVGMDNNHTIFVWNWRQNSVLAELKGHTDAPPKVYGVLFDPFGANATTFLSYGEGTHPTRESTLETDCLAFLNFSQGWRRQAPPHTPPFPSSRSPLLHIRSHDGAHNQFNQFKRDTQRETLFFSSALARVCVRYVTA